MYVYIMNKIYVCIELMTQLRENKGLILKTAYNNTRGFFIQITGFTKLGFCKVI